MSLNKEKTTPVQRNLLLFRFLIVLAIPASGFLSTACAFLGFYEVDSIWPYIMLPGSVLIPAAIFIDYFWKRRQTDELNSSSIILLNRIHLAAIIIFSAALVWWFIYFLLYVELHK